MKVYDIFVANLDLNKNIAVQLHVEGKLEEARTISNYR